jgi:hypothetical protein
VEVWNKFNPRERMIAIGALIVIVGWIVSLVSAFGIGGNTITLIGAIAVLVILYLKYAPNQNITWPAPVPLILLGISGISGLLALVSLLQWVSLLGGFASVFGLALISAVVTAVGAALMVWGSWQEYQLSPKTTGTTSSAPGPAPTAPPPAPPAPPSQAPSAPPPPATPAPPPIRPEDDDRPPV